VAGVHADHAHAAAAHAHLAQFGFEFGGQAVERRREARGNAAVGPHQFFSQQGEAGPAPTPGFEQGLAEQLLGVAQQAPGVAVGQPDRPWRPAAIEPCVLDRQQQR
jgi:hypothetical protein